MLVSRVLHNLIWAAWSCVKFGLVLANMKCDTLVAGSVTDEQLSQVGSLLADQSKPLKQRFRALFTLQNIGGCRAVELICAAFVGESSALLKHELAYCLGQIGDASAISRLSDVLSDVEEDAMVRHEAGEALGAIGDDAALPLLERMSADPIREVADTCRLAAERIRWLNKTSTADNDSGSTNPYHSVDPAPPLAPIREGPSDPTTTSLGSILSDANQPLWDRYRAMFTLRDRGGDACVHELAAALRCDDSALLRHEVAFVLGQMASPAAIEALVARLEDAGENYMVRHECAEALGAIATDRCMEVLRRFVGDSCPVVSQSCVVALDVAEYELSGAFQYADALSAAKSAAVAS